MNKKDKYFGANGWSPSKRDSSRYEKVWEQMQLLQIEDVSTKRQDKNGTIIWRLPIKHPHGRHLIEVGSFKSGMVRNQNCAYSNYQLNKCEPYTEYYKDYEYEDENGNYIFDNPKWTGKYNKCVSKRRILIPIEIDRLEYLIRYCLKNYYIKNANLVPNGEYIQKWEHYWELKKAKQDTKDNCYNVDNLSVTVNGERYKII